MAISKRHKGGARSCTDTLSLGSENGVTGAPDWRIQSGGEWSGELQPLQSLHPVDQVESAAEMVRRKERRISWSAINQYSLSSL